MYRSTTYSRIVRNTVSCTLQHDVFEAHCCTFDVVWLSGAGIDFGIKVQDLITADEGQQTVYLLVKMV